MYSPTTHTLQRRAGARLASITVAAGLVFSACGSDDTDLGSRSQPLETAVEPAGGADSAQGTTNAGAESRPAVLALQRETLAGAELDVAQYAGRDVLVWFWAPW